MVRTSIQTSFFQNAFWSLVPLPFLNPAWTSGSSWFMYCWSLAWRILSITLLVCPLESITTNKPSGGDGIPVELFQILKDDAAKVLHSIHQQIWKTQQWPQDWKRSVFISIPKKSNAKECSNYCAIALILHASKVMLKILQARLQQYVNHELPDIQASFRKDRGTRGQIANIRWIMGKVREFQKKHIFLLYWLRQSLWLCGSQ